jgi:hypothetical protein
MRTIAESFDWVLAHKDRYFYMHNRSGKWFIEIHMDVEVYFKSKPANNYTGSIRVEARDFDDLQAGLDHAINEAETNLIADRVDGDERYARNKSA